MTLDQLEMLEAVLKAGSFKAAAKMLNKSQPSISVGIKKIEEEFGVQLFSRDAYRPQLTDQGRVLYKAGLDVLQSMRTFECKAKELASGIEPTVIISIDPLVNFSALRGSLTQIINGQTSTELVFQERILNENEQAVLSGKADIGIGIISPSQNDLEWQYISEETLVPSIAKTWVRGSELNSEFLGKIPRIVVENQDEHHMPSKRCLVSSHHQKEQFILAGFGWGRIRKSFFNKNKTKLSLIDPQVTPYLQLRMAIFKHKLKPLGPTSQRLWHDLLEASQAN